MLVDTSHPEHVFHRLRRVLSSLYQHCDCREKISGALDRFEDLEQMRELRAALAEARRQRDWIGAQLSFLAELDDINEHETDKTVFEEMAMLFDEVADAATRAAKMVRTAASDVDG